MDINLIWNRVKNKLREELTSISFDLWIKTLAAEKFEKSSVYLFAESSTVKSQITKLHLNRIKELFKEENVNILDVIILDSIDKENLNNSAPVLETKTVTNNYNPNFTFESFVAGKSNQFVYAACKSVAENPGSKVNPLFFYGNSGLGKTHLLNAIANYIAENKPELKVILTTTENFTNDYLETLRNKDVNITSFRDKYRNCDILLIDDIQFIAKKTSTQEEFFHTFNDLFNLGKQIVITSDKHPNQIDTLEDRMRSRFVSGLIQDIQQPDVEMRIVILQKKADIEGQKIDEKLITYVAEYSEENNFNTREMEGILKKILLYSELIGKKEPTIEDFNEAIKENIKEKQKVQTTCDVILDKVSTYFNINKAEIVGKKRNKEFIEPRMITIFLIDKFLNIPLVSIGEFMGKRDHTTIMHSKNKIANDYKNVQRVKTAIDDISMLITNN